MSKPLNAIRRHAESEGRARGMLDMTELSDDDCIMVMTELGLLYRRGESERDWFPRIRKAFEVVYERKTGA